MIVIEYIGLGVIAAAVHKGLRATRGLLQVKTKSEHSVFKQLGDTSGIDEYLLIQMSFEVPDLLVSVFDVFQANLVRRVAMHVRLSFQDARMGTLAAKAMKLFLAHYRQQQMKWLAKQAASLNPQLIPAQEVTG